MFNESEIARNAMFETLDNQLAAGNPPEVRETLDRLVADGHSEVEARRLIVCALVTEIFEVMQDGRTYDDEKYVRTLRALPKLPWD